MIQLDPQNARHIYRLGEPSRALWNARTLWQPGKSRRRWEPAVLDEFQRWVARHPDADHSPSHGNLGGQLPRLSRFARSIRFELTRGSDVTRLVAISALLCVA